MDTNNPLEDRSRSRKESAQNGKRAKWARNPQAQRLLAYYGLSLDGPMPVPLFGIQRFTLNVYNGRHELTPRQVAPSLDYLSQDLGLAENAGYEAIKNLKIDDAWLNRLLDDSLERGKHELQRYLRNLRPLLIKRGIYLYCTLPSTLLKTDVKTGQYTSEKGKRPLVALPTSVESAELLGRSQEEIQGLAPQVARLILMLVLYRKVKLTDELQVSFDGWLDILSGQQREQMHTSIVRYAPSLITDQITGLLLPEWLKRE